MRKKKEDIEIGYRIRQIRNKLDMDQKEFAEKIETSVSALSNWENGRNKPKTKPAEKIAQLGKMSINELLYGQNYMILQDKIIKAFYPHEHEKEERIWLKDSPWAIGITDKMFESIKDEGLVSKIQDLYIGMFETDEKGKYNLGFELTDKDAIETKLNEILKSDKEHIINKEAFSDTVSCFSQLEINIEDMDFMTVYMQNLHYHEEQNGYRINSKESYLNFLEERIGILENKLKEDDLSLIDKSTFEMVLKIDKNTLKKIM